MRILLVEDDADLADGLLRALRAPGHAVDHLRDGEEADLLLRHEPFDLVVLDLGLPGRDGLDVLKGLRARGNAVPVLVLTARDALDQRIAGLDLGADDYLAKPFALPELEARVRALLRRGSGRASSRIVHGRVALDTRARRVTVDGAPVELPRRELCVLEVLLTRAGEVLSKEQIANQLYSFDDEAGLTSIELYVHRLRKRLAPAGLDIRTVRGLGYYVERP
ncbi:response regulator [Azospirillum halopraeferens]|uniref:response regulator n=1 Tax=Azospirillum halopraeferens TaxID=34010 RepID=UPI000429F2A1|nr:response regulator [Azospirillum halopraeferens]